MPINYLKEARLEAEMSQCELGRKSKVAPQTISSIETMRLLPGLKVKKRLARVLHKTIEELFPLEVANGR